MNLCQIVYVSDRDPKMQEGELTAITDAASIKNAACGITGLLLSGGGHFIQVLEGNPMAVNSLYEKIARDARHNNVKRLLQRTVESRFFPEWGMKLAQTRVMPIDQERLDNTLIRIRLGKDQDTSQAALLLLNEFRIQLMSKAA